MHTDNIIIRLEQREEYREVENLIRESFWNVYRPGTYEHYVMHVLRDAPAFVKELDFVMDDADVEEFDKSFPPKEKLKLPGQIFS